jgi:3-deoxy-D-manno-octulosonic-acid transferase
VLEAAVFGLPSLFGPIYHQFIEAEELIAVGGAAVVSDKAQLLDEISRLSNPNIYDSFSQASIKYVNSKIGATNALLQFISHSYGI